MNTKINELIKINDIDGVKSVLLNNPELSSREIRNVLEKLIDYDEEFVKDCIKNRTIRMSNADKIYLIKDLDDEEFTKECILDDNIGFSVQDKISLIISQEEDFIKECLENNILNFSSEEIESLLKWIHDPEFEYKLLTDESFDIPLDLKMRIILRSYNIAEYIDKFPWLALFDKNANQNELDKTLKDNKKITLLDKMTIGIELESEGVMSEYIKSHFTYKRWQAKSERTLLNGVEIVSPILHATEEDSKEIYFISDMLRNVGQKITNDCGGHIHIGADYLKSKEAWANFFEIYCNVEKILYAVCNEADTVPRSKVTRTAPPIALMIREAIESGAIDFESKQELHSFISDLKNIQRSDNVDDLQDTHQSYNRFFGVNLSNLKTSKNTIEFRFPNGTLNPQLWIENINLLGGIVEIAQELAEIQELENPTEDQRRKVELFEQLKANIVDEEKLKILLELLGLEPTNYINRYNSNIKLLKENSKLYESFMNEPFVIKKKKVMTREQFKNIVENASALEQAKVMDNIAIVVKESRSKDNERV